MSNCCEEKSCDIESLKKDYSRVLKIILLINLAMFFIEFAAGILGRSTALLALAANAYCLWTLTRFRDDDLNMRSVWICSRNDIISNVSVLAAAGLVGLPLSKGRKRRGLIPQPQS